MGNVVRTIATPITVIGTTLTGSGSEKIYYTCPTCKERVWVYKKYEAWKGSSCFKCN